MTETTRGTAVMTIPAGAAFAFGGLLGARIHANQAQWLLQAPVANPAMLQMFRDRDRTPRRALLPWSGEFPGKYLISAVQGYRLTRDPELLALLRHFVAELIAVQDADGYLGPHPAAERLTGKTVGGEWLWDLWGHYHCMLGLLYWYRETGEAAARPAGGRAADLLCQRFLDTGARAHDADAHEMNLAVGHVLCQLYAETGTARYLQLAREVERDWETPPAGDYLRAALHGVPFYQTPKPRWESLHAIQAITELYLCTGDDRYRRALLHHWQSMRATDRHNTGAFSSGEQATGNPYDNGAIETCCVIAWIALSIDALRLTGDPTVADEIELATFNAVLGAQHPSGRWWTYHTPMDGVRKASAHDIVFQAHQGAPELNCCAVNGPRGLGMLAEWAYLLTEDGVAVNFYGPNTVTLQHGHGRLTLRQETAYPRDGAVRLLVQPDAPHRCALHLRIPAWSTTTTVIVNGEPVGPVTAGTYLVLDRAWTAGDTITLHFDLALHAWVGAREKAGLVSLYRGPILLTYDQRDNVMDPDDLLDLDILALQRLHLEEAPDAEGWLRMHLTGAEGCPLVLRDFASAGSAGTYYRSWLPLPAEQASLLPRSCFAAR